MKPEFTTIGAEPVAILRSRAPIGGGAPGSAALRSGAPGSCETRDQAPDGRFFDPVQMGWLASALSDDLDPADVLGPLVKRDPLTGTGLALRPWRRADLPVFCTLLDDPQVWEHLPEPRPVPLTEALAADLIAASAFEAHHCVRALTEGDVPVGQVRLAWATDSAPPATTPRDARHEAEIGYWLGRAHWGRGLGRRLLAAGVARAFGNAPHLRRLVARVRPANLASRRLLEGAGFTPIDPAGRAQGWLWLGLRRQDRRGISNEESP